MHHRLALIGTLMALALATEMRAQLPAFPGAEGAAMFATGGRGSLASPGDVYVVTTLADYDPDNDGSHPSDVTETAIVGSLRHGILTAPSSGRTIVFAVSGTIELHDLLDFKGRDNITIAGQTAPGGGITLAKHETRINDANNVILQHLRFRPGERLPGSYSSPAYFPAGYDPDALSVTGSTNVMIDHVTASWSVDEGLSVTSNSNLVTVQWSTITQALNSAGHSEMDPSHSFGSLINGGNYTYHHNFYAHNRSRHPRPQGPTLTLDWVNNVVYNPGDRYGYSEASTSGDNYSLNIVNNFGLDGPNTSAPSLFNARTTASDIYAPSGSVLDFNNNGLLETPLASGGNFVSGTFTESPTRFAGAGNSLHEVDTTSADQAYIQVLSRAGANFHRDEIDRRTLRTVFNQLGGFLNSQSDWGGWPDLPAGTAPVDTNLDGVPDEWASERGFDPMSIDNSQRLNRVFAPSGYTYLGEYIHSLTPYSYAPVNVVSHEISTSIGRGADAFVGENGGGSATSSGNGLGGSLDVAYDGNGGDLNQAILLKFDLSGIVPGSVTSARLDLTASSEFNGTHSFKVYGLEHDAAGWDWDEGSIAFDAAPGLEFDGDSGTLGIDPDYNPFSPVDLPGLLTLGTMSADNLNAGQTASLDNLNLAVFLNLAAYFEGSEHAGLVTLIVEQTNDSDSSVASFYSQEGSAALAPRLVVDAVLAEVVEPILLGDYNGNGVVDAADYTVWRDHLGTDFNLNGNGDEAGGSAGIVDQADYLAWKNNFGATTPGGSGALSKSTVPEPSSVVMLITTWAALVVLRSGRKESHCRVKARPAPPAANITIVAGSGTLAANAALPLESR
jgi:pectate lyase